MSPLDRIRLIGPLPPSITMRRRLWTALLVLYAGAIFALSQMPVSVGEPPFAHFDKVLHAAEFALFAAIASRATDRRLLFSFVLTAVYAGTDELHQLLVATRTASALDFGADLLGAALALLALEAASRLLGSRRRRILARSHSKVES